MLDYAKTLGNKVYENRERLKMTQAELAEKTGVTEQTIRKIEHGKGNPQLLSLCAIITALGINPTEIIYPQQEITDPARVEAEMLLAECTDEQIHDLIPIIEAAIRIVKGRSLTTTK